MLCLSRKRMVVTKDRPLGPGHSVPMFIVVECEDHSAIQAPLYIKMVSFFLVAVSRNQNLTFTFNQMEHGYMTILEANIFLMALVGIIKRFFWFKKHPKTLANCCDYKVLWPQATNYILAWSLHLVSLKSTIKRCQKIFSLDFYSTFWLEAAMLCMLGFVLFCFFLLLTWKSEDLK